MSLSVTFEAHVLNKLLRNTDFTSPNPIYIALYTTAPSDNGGGVEVSSSGTGYARQTVTFGAVSGGSPSQVQNNAQVLFPEATANWNTVVAASLMTASTGGTLICWANLAQSKAINAGDQAVFNVGSITVTCN